MPEPADLFTQRRLLGAQTDSPEQLCFGRDAKAAATSTVRESKLRWPQPESVSLADSERPPSRPPSAGTDRWSLY
jgi:hypothetical protein